MKIETFFEKFDLITDAPNAVLKMRELTLQFAVQGRLVPQEPQDGSAAQQLGALDLGTLELEPRFNIPHTWIWAPLDPLLTMMKNGFNGKPNKTGGHYKVTRIETIAREIIDLSRVGFAENLPPPIVEKHLIKSGDILFSHINSEPHLGKTAICTFDDPTLLHGVNLLLLRSKNQIDPRYLNITLRELRASGYFVSIAQRAINQSSINQKNLGKTLIPVPPLVEQKRIVAKVDELMALCDRLEAQQQERDTRHAALARASVARFAEAPTLANLNFLFHNSYTIEPVDLRKTILTLAVLGKLVIQDPNDEPAFEQKDHDLQSGHPPNWCCGTVFDLAGLKSGTSFPSEMELADGEFLYVKVADMNLPENQHEITTSSRFVTPDENALKSLIPSGSIIFPKRGGAIATNKKRLVKRPLFVDTNTMAMICPAFIELRYLHIWFLGIDLWGLNSGTSVPQINNKDIGPLIIPVPPLAEQRRIVAKVDQLMALIDQLETELAASRDTATSLMHAIVAELSAEA